MISQDEHLFLLRCHLLGKARGDQQKKEKSHFFSKSWQAKYIEMLEKEIFQAVIYKN